MPLGDGHRHDDIASHDFACRMEQAAFIPLTEQLKDRPNVILGEMDVKADIAAIEITFPQAGVLFFDVSDPSQPKFLSRYNATECDQLLEDINCGAFVDLAPDGKTAYLSIQKLTLLPTLPLNPNALNQAGPGVDVIDLANPRKPVRTQFYPILGLGGVHTVRSHTIPAGPSSADRPRAAGEYVISNQNGVGIDIAKVTRVAGKRFLTTVRNLLSRDLTATIVNNEVHDTFIQNDPLDGRTYLYNAAGFSTGFSVYDITDPTRLKQVAEWDLTPECEDDWYAHTIDVTHRRRPALRDDAGRDAAAGRQEHADRPRRDDRRGPGGRLRDVRRQRRQARAAVDRRRDRLLQARPGERPQDAAEAEATDAALKKASQDALVATWTNPAGRAGGSLTFSPHNQQIVGDKIYLSHYHGGVYVLDASAAFAGRRERPKELGFIVPHDTRTRPLLGQPPLTGLLGRFFTDFPLGRPEVWDMVVYKDHVLASDMTGGPVLAEVRRQPAAAVRRRQAPALGAEPQALEPARRPHPAARQRERPRLLGERGDAQARRRGQQGQRRRGAQGRHALSLPQRARPARQGARVREARLPAREGHEELAPGAQGLVPVGRRTA